MKPISLKPLSFSTTANKPTNLILSSKSEVIDFQKKKNKFTQAIEMGTHKDTENATSALESLFKKRLKRIKKSSIENDYGEIYRIQVYKALMDMVLDLIPVAEAKYRVGKEDKSMYALNVVINQSREIANDMRSVQDFEQQALQIIRIIRQNYSLIAENFVDEIHRSKIYIQEGLVPDEVRRINLIIKEMTDTHARFLNETLKAMTSQVSEFLVEKPDTRPNQNKKGVISAPKAKFSV